MDSTCSFVYIGGFLGYGCVWCVVMGSVFLVAVMCGRWVHVSGCFYVCAMGFVFIVGW